MGNHYVNLTAPELAALALNQSGLDKWNATWIWGGFGGQVSAAVSSWGLALPRCPAGGWVSARA